MFTGIIEEIGQVQNLNKSKENFTLQIKAEKILEGTKIGDSIAVNGVCLTVNKIIKNTLEFNVMSSTLHDTSLGRLKRKSEVNLERAALPTTRLGGHLVSGHVDTTGKVKSIIQKNGQLTLIIYFPEKFSPYVLEKGSIALDGISLTIQSCGADYFTLGIIPHSLDNTILKNLQEGDTVNLEFDLLAKYIENLLAKKQKNTRKRISKYSLL